MPTLNLISGLLGGIGKSLFSRVLIHIHETEGISFVAMDADPQTCRRSRTSNVSGMNGTIEEILN